MKKNFTYVASPWLTLLLMILFAIAIAIATFYENLYGTPAARAFFYSSKWFHLLMFALSVNLVAQIVSFRLYKPAKLTLLMFHVSFILILAGAAITFYTSKEGFVHLRKGQESDKYTTAEQYLWVSLYSKQKKVFSDSAIIEHVNQFTKNFKVLNAGDTNYSVLELVGYKSNAHRKLQANQHGFPAVSIMLMKDSITRYNIVLGYGERFQEDSIKLEVSDSLDAKGIIFYPEGDTFFIKFNVPLSKVDVQTGYIEPLPINTLLKVHEGDVFIVERKVFLVSQLLSNAIIIPSDDKGFQNTGPVYIFNWKIDGVSQPLYLWLSPEHESMVKVEYNDYRLILRISRVSSNLPFSLILNNFVVEHYPGSSNPSSYRSEITLIDNSTGDSIRQSILVNKFLKYKGWRIYQASFDPDNQGSILSVSYDPWGITLSFIGYAILFIFLILSLFNPRTRFRNIKSTFFKSTIALILLILITNLQLYSKPTENVKSSLPQEVVKKLDEVLVQDIAGRTKPIHTLADEVIRKVSGTNSLFGYSSSQLFWNIYTNTNHWLSIPMIKVNKDISIKLGLDGKELVAFNDLVDFTSGDYRIGQWVKHALTKPLAERNKFDKEIIKIDERVNIFYMIASGDLLKVLPFHDDSLRWLTPNEYLLMLQKGKANSKGLTVLGSLLADSLANLQNPRDIQQIISYQYEMANYILPSKNQVKAEIWYNRLKINERLFPYFILLGFLLLTIIILSTVSFSKTGHYWIKFLIGLYVIGLIMLFSSFLLRWYIANRIPLANGYETMIFISWVSLLLGLIFFKRSTFVVAAASILSGFSLLVAHLSFMDPQITNLVPVLQSHWLTLHVSVITSSYGFLGFSAIVGLIVLILYAVRLSDKAKMEHVKNSISSLSAVSYKSLTLGLVLLTIGTFLGAIWANESWGRYWGWDPKESWSLITILTYSVLIHSLNISGVINTFRFNLLALWSFSTVLMTYFGVNYYFSGLHSYAGGSLDDISWLPIIIIALFLVLSYFGWLGYNKNYYEKKS